MSRVTGAPSLVFRGIVRTLAEDIVDPLADDPRGARWGVTLAFIASAALAAATLRLSWQRPLVSVAVLAGAAVVVVVRWLSRRRLRRLLLSGDVRSVLDRWSPALA